jgi:hypothetical protein
MLSDSIDMSDIYDNSDPDTSIIYSELNNENSKKLVIKMIDEFGGFDEFVSTEKQLKGLDESAVIDFILNERFGRILDRLSEDSETMMDIKNIYVDFENYGHYIKNRKEVLYSFQDIIGKELKYDILDKDGTDYYRIEFEDKWLIDEEDVEYQDYENLKLIDVLRNYCEVQDFNYDLKPNFSDYGEVDSKSFNAEVKSILK